MKTFKIVAILILATGPLFSQANGFFDDFEDGKVDTLWNETLHTLWIADHPATFGITESDGFLNIAYTRTAGSAAWDNFNFTPPEQIDVTNNPKITLKIRSDVATTFTVKPIYANELSGWLSKEIPADNAWHFYTYELSASNYTGSYLTKIYLYLDGGSTEIKSGMVRFDDFQIAGFSISVDKLQAVLIDSSKIDLHWESSDPVNTDHFNIYRSTEMGFPVSELTKIGETTDTLFHDTDLIKNTTYFYQVTATDVDGKEHAPAAVSMRTSTPGSIPKPKIISENANPVGTYDKYEVVISMPEATFSNPYDPEEIDLYAWFWSPAGDSVKMNGFYDNYQGADQWKIRFAARQAGTWEYRVFATDLDGTGSSDLQTFSAVESGNKGWLHISPGNPNYFVHDDGSSFYGVSVYYPWSVTETGLDEFAAVDGNFFGYWDCTYDWSGNGGGRYILESMDAGLGKYDQRKAARIDEVLTWADARDMKVMLAMWAHPYLRIEGIPWDNGQWLSDNPYSSIVEPEEFFTDSLAWAYQQKHYRYMIARWGYSQAMGIWEIVNELHGTTGWVRNQEGSLKWVEKVHAYFKENDPFQRATTASFGGGEGASYYSETDRLGDIPNVHFYELHGWPNPYPDNLVRSGLANVVSESRKLKSKGDRPAFFGEAGYTSMLTDVATEAYTWEMHNAFWAGLANGLASTPFWWDFTSKDVISPERMQIYPPFNTFLSDIDFAHLALEPAGMWAEGSDGYFMGATSSGFGWMKSHEEASLSHAPVYISGTELSNGTYLMEWFNTWTGEYMDTDTALCVEGHTWGEVTNIEKEDVAFKISKLDSGASAIHVGLALIKTDTLVPGPHPWSPMKDSTIYKIVCYVTDGKHMLDVAFNGQADIRIDGEGQLDPFTLNLHQGGVVFDYHRSGSSPATINASVDGLGSAVLYIEGVTGIEENKANLEHHGYELKNYPNPFDRSTTIAYVLPEHAHINLAVYNAQGKLVETLVNERQPAGYYRVVWNAERYPAGIYLYKLGNGQFSETGRCVLLR
ncbi:MAG: DUF5060 domain-containing protein [Bacteroidota bacterium]